MEDFTAITTQEQLDTILGERLRRERETLGKKYADYEELKKKVADYEKQLSDTGRAMKEANEKLAGHEKEVAELQSKVKAYETDSVKTRIANEMGIPYEFASRLAGEDEAAIRKDAEGIAKLIGKQRQAPPLKSTEPDGADDKTSAYRSMLNNMKGE